MYIFFRYPSIHPSFLSFFWKRKKKGGKRPSRLIFPSHRTYIPPKKTAHLPIYLSPLPSPPLPSPSPSTNQPTKQKKFNKKLTPRLRIFPYSIATGSLCLLFLLIILALIQQRQLLPGIVVLGSFILFVLFLTGLIETSIQLYGPTGSVNSYCNLYRPSSGVANGQATLAWLETQGICQDWKAVFSFYIIGTVFLLWMMVMAYQVNQDNFD